MRRRVRAALRFAAALMWLAVLPQVATAAEPVEYELRFGKPSSHLLEISDRKSTRLNSSH